MQAKLIEPGVYGVAPEIEGKRLVKFNKITAGAWWDEGKPGMQVLDMAGNVLKVVDDTQTAEEALNTLGYELIATA